MKIKKICYFMLLIICISFSGCSYDSGNNWQSNSSNNSSNTPSIIAHTVSFNSNGGTTVASQKTRSLTKAPTTTRSQHEFKGWYMDAALLVPVTYPLNVNTNMTLYAKWLRVKSEATCKDTSIKLGDNRAYGSVYAISPSYLDLNALASEGYIIETTVTYDVYYRKDYDVLWDIGYAGSPKYEVYIRNSDKLGVANEDMPTSTAARTRTITYKNYAANYLNTQIYLEFSTNNIQNIIYFKNISVTYTCYR